MVGPENGRGDGSAGLFSAQGYESLRQQVVQTLVRGQQRAREAVEREKVQTCWEVGDLLNEHLKEHDGRAMYGDQVLTRLARDLEMAQRRLYEMLQFRRAFPILRSSARLTFSHYVKLSRLTDPSAREFYEGQAEDGGWSVRQLEAAIRAGTFERLPTKAGEDPVGAGGTPDGEVATLTPRKGRLYTHRVLTADEGEVALDLGFRIRLRMQVEGDNPDVEAGQVVECVRDPSGAYTDNQGRGFRLEVDDRPRTKLYTYPVRVLSVIDGDTVWAEIDCGFGISIEEKLRFRGINTPEMPSDEGVRAREYVVEALGDADPIVMTTSRTDLYDRYVADLFYLPGEGEARQVLRRGRHLNGELLSVNLAALWE